LLVQTGYGRGEKNCEPDWRAETLIEAVEIIMDAIK
jgi:hypothetical protein